MLDFLQRSAFNQIIVRLTRSRTQLRTRISLNFTVFLTKLAKIEIFNVAKYLIYSKKHDLIKINLQDIQEKQIN